MLKIGPKSPLSFLASGTQDIVILSDVVCRFSVLLLSSQIVSHGKIWEANAFHWGEVQKTKKKSKKVWKRWEIAKKMCEIADAEESSIEIYANYIYSCNAK